MTPTRIQGTQWQQRETHPYFPVISLMYIIIVTYFQEDGRRVRCDGIERARRC